MHIKRLLFIGIFLFVSLVHVLGQSMSEQLNQFVAKRGVDVANVGIYIYDLDSNAVLGEWNATKLLSPASTTKLFSTAYALETLGGEYQPKTNVYYHGKIVDSSLIGNVYVVGGGDMSLGSRYFSPENREGFLKDWTKALQQLGIKRIQGDVIADGAQFGYEGAPSDWLWGDLGNYYGAHFSGLMIYDNTLDFHFKLGAAGKKAQLIRTFPQLDSLQFTNNVVASKRGGDNSYIYGSPYVFKREARGELPQNTADFRVRGSLPDPELQVAVEFRRVLLEAGIAVDGKALTTRTSESVLPKSEWTSLLEHKGIAVNELIKVTNYESVNVFAEGLMRLATFHQAHFSTHDVASENMQAYWKAKLNADALYLTDGSGLSRTNAINAKTMCDLLTYMYKSDNRMDYYNSLPITGVSGTMKNVAKNQLAHNRIHAKSGTMKRTKSYAGYVDAISGRKLAFAFIVNNYSCSNRELVAYLEELMNAMTQL